VTGRIRVRAEGYAPGARICITCTLTDDEGLGWLSAGHFVAGADGAAQLDEAPSEGGTYQGTHGDGLFWSMLPQSPQQGRDFMTSSTARLHRFGMPQVEPLAPLRFDLEASCDGYPSARASCELVRLAPGIDVEPLEHGRLRGQSFMWRDRTRSKGAVLTVGGSGGGLELTQAPLIASLGYDVLSLAYFAYQDLPTTLSEIPLEYFGEAFSWMRSTYGHQRVAVQGGSRGGELTLVLTAYFPQHVLACVAMVPMYAVTHGWDPATNAGLPAWTIDGKPLPWVVPTDQVPMSRIREIGRAEVDGYPASAAYFKDLDTEDARTRCAIPIECARAAILLVSGDDDQMWPCSWGSDLVVNRLRAKGYTHGFKHLRLCGTGHVLPTPHMVTSSVRAMYHPLAKVFLACGGWPEPAARNAWVMWEAIAAHYESAFARSM
jgi:acyl-coenzyme A thioesterase 1/2/4